MKKLIKLLTFILVVSIIVFSIEPITDKLADLLKHEPKIIISPPNEYYRDTNFEFVKNSEDFIPYSKQDIKNIFYSILNNGYETFTFYCPSEYVNCIDDIKDISNEGSNINNFVHPYNSFSNFNISYDESGEITVEIQKLYTQAEITLLNIEIEKIINKIIKSDMDEEEIILTIHDYIINNAKYDLSYDPDKERNESKYQSYMAIGPLLQGYSICSGYTDTMALFLNRFDIPNYKVASKTHIWNAVYIDGKWLHLDLTWDDPVNENNPDKNNLIHKFFLITTKTLESNKITDHDYDKTIYLEMMGK